MGDKVFSIMASQQPSLFESRSYREPGTESWGQVVARRMQSLLMTYPIQQMVNKGESGYHPEWREQNFTFLALQVFDSVFARMAPGIGRGATREEIISDLKPLILARSPELDDDQTAAIVDFVLDHLMNEGKGVFEQECIWLEKDEQVKPFSFRFGLLKSYHYPETDQFIIRATPEAIHLYLRMLDQPIEDEQIANLMILQEQVNRGRITRARREAERTMLLSLEYERFIEDMLRAVRRDVRGVDWVREVTPKLEEAHEHVQRLIRNQGQVLSDLKKELQRNDDRARLRAIHDLIELLEICQRRHMELERSILAAGPAFLEEQAYQRFRNMARSPMPDLNEQVFMPGIHLPGEFFQPICRKIFGMVMGPQIERMMDLELFIDKLLREEDESEDIVNDEDFDERLPIVNAFNPLDTEMEEKIAELLLKVEDRPIRLSHLLDAGRDAGLETDGLAQLGVTLLHSYHRRSDLLGFNVTCDGRALEDPEFEGDDLLFVRRLDDDEAPDETQPTEAVHV